MAFIAGIRTNPFAAKQAKGKTRIKTLGIFNAKK